MPIAVLRGRGMRRKESRLATLVYSLQEMPGEIRRADLAAVEPQRHQPQHRARGAGARVHPRVSARGRGAHRAPSDARPADLPLSRRAGGLRSAAAAQAPGAPARAAGRRRARASSASSPPTAREPESQLWRKAERYFDEMAANFHGSYFSILEFLFNRIWPRLFQGVEYAGLDSVTETHAAAPGGAGAVPPQPLRLPDHLVPVPRQLPQSAAHRRRHQPLVLAARPAVPRRRRLLHPPQLRGQRALQGGLPLVPHVPHPRGLHAGVLHRGRAQPHRQDPHPEARHVVGDGRCVPRRRPPRSLLRAGVDPLRPRRRGGRVPARAGRRGEGAGIAGGPGARAPRAAPPPRHGRHHLRRADLAQPGAGRDRKECFRDGDEPEVSERKRRFVQKLGFRLLRERERRVGRRGDVGVGDGAARPAARACRIDEFVTRGAGADALPARPRRAASPPRWSATPRTTSARTSPSSRAAG